MRRSGHSSKRISEADHSREPEIVDYTGVTAQYGRKEPEELPIGDAVSSFSSDQPVDYLALMRKAEEKRPFPFRRAGRNPDPDGHNGL